MAGATTIRQSCDRCRGQKLRCERDDVGDTGACTRCIRQGSQCVYSYSLPKGRPNQYRLVAADQATYTHGTDSTSKRRANTPISPEVQRPASAPRVNDTTATATAPTFEHPQGRTNTRIRTDGNARAIEDAAFMDALTAYPKNAPLAAPTLPWLGQWGWSDLQIEEDGNEQSEDMTGLIGSGFQLQNAHLDPLLDQHAPPSQWIAATGMKETRGEPGTGNVSSTRASQEQRLAGNNDALENRRDQNSHSNDSTMSAMEMKGPGAAIAQLTQLSMRLHPLHSSSQALPENTGSPSSNSADRQVAWQSRPSLVADKAVFRMIMTRLIQGWCEESLSPPNSETVEQLSLSSILQEALTASYYLLDIIERLQQKSKTGPGSGSGSGNSPLTPIPTPNGSESGAPSFKTGGQPSNTVVRHLVMACHGMLLSIYTAVLGVLQRDAERLVSMSQDASGKGSGTETIEEIRPLGDLHLAMMVQLCGYVIGRQQQAVAACITPQSSNGGPEGFLPDPSGASMRNDLEAEVKQVLARLRHTLRVE